MCRCKDLPQDFVRLAVLISLLAACAFAAQAQVVFSPPVNVSAHSTSTLGVPSDPQVAVDRSNNIDIVWDYNPTSAGHDIYFSRSTDGGRTFSAPLNISKHPGSSQNPQIALDHNGNVNVFWVGDITGSPNLFFSRSNDGGATFSVPQNVSTGVGASVSFFPQSIAVDTSNNINVAWVGINGQVFFARSADGGLNFSAPLNISNYPNAVEFAFVAVDGAGNINILWQGFITFYALGFAGCADYGLFLSRSTDGGATFTTSQNIATNTQFGAFWHRFAVDSGGKIDIVYNASCPFSSPPVNDLFFTESRDNGASFSSPLILTAPTIGGSGGNFLQLGLGSSGSNIYVAWPGTDPQSGRGVTVFNRSTDSGSTFSAANPISTNSGAFQIAVDSFGNIDILSGGSGGMLRSTDGGAAFSSVSLPDNSFASIIQSSFALDTAGDINLIWLGYASQPSQQDVFFSRGTVLALASLGLNVTSVAGGSTATGTVRLNAPAPAGGTVVSLSSSKSSATVPSSVTVAPGFTNVTFTVSTSRVLCLNSAAISGSFSGVTQTANLAVMPFVTLPQQACAAITAHGGGPH
ncbi:MAG TPA: sialidase family protein [Candidatus Acidoferrum sp.]|nr:sialidase family protein [Candidatus Acidoferrum sp.]